MDNSVFISAPSYALFLSTGDGTASGSGFLFSLDTQIFLVTAKHVVWDDKKSAPLANKIIARTFAVGVHPSRTCAYDINISQDTILTDKKYDIAAIPLGKLDGSIAYVDIIDGFNTPSPIDQSDALLFPELQMGNEIFVLGFATSLISNNPSLSNILMKPLLRKGILSGLDNTSNDEKIIIHCPVYYGDSGGAVLAIHEESSSIRLIGVISRYIPFQTQWVNPREPQAAYTEYSNSGFCVCIPVNAVIDLITKYNNAIVS